MDVSSSPIRGIIFDKDGTLFDFGSTWEAWASAFLLRAADNNFSRAAKLGKSIGYDLYTQKFTLDSIVIAGTPYDIANLLIPHFPDQSQSDLVDLLNEEATKVPQAEAVPLIPFLSELRGRGFKLGIATNDFEAPAIAHLQSAEIMSYFEFIAGSDSGYGGKPAPGQLLGFCDVTGLPPSETLMVGDSLHDLRAARAAKMRAFGVLTGLANESELAPFSDAVRPDIGYLPDWLKRYE